MLPLSPLGERDAGASARGRFAKRPELSTGRVRTPGACGRIDELEDVVLKAQSRNRDAKLVLCDLRSIADAAKQLRRRWKAIGHVPRDEADHVWNAFNEACDDVFSALDRERDQRAERFRDRIESIIAKKRELIVSQEEQIERLEEHITRWNDTIDNLRGGRGAYEIGMS